MLVVVSGDHRSPDCVALSLQKIKPTTEVIKIITEMDTTTASGRLKLQGALGRERERPIDREKGKRSIYSKIKSSMIICEYKKNNNNYKN